MLLVDAASVARRAFPRGWNRQSDASVYYNALSFPRRERRAIPDAGRRCNPLARRREHAYISMLL